MKYLWDTDTCAYFLNRHDKINQRLQTVGGENICTTIINIAELKFGAYNSTRIEENLKSIEKLQSILTMLDDFNDTIVTTFAKNKALLRKMGISIGDFDLLIGSFALANELIVITNNIEHFKHIPDLQIENWIR